ncbi:MAG: phytanoyl-CoA dioxygenase [Azospira oryzae]|nr:MAG: phytanoyl-CoA dioxygenase [Azospira oryzae]
MQLTAEQKAFFDQNGFIHFKNFITRETVSRIHQEMEKIQNKWIAEDVKLVNGVPIKYGTNTDGRKIVQRFAFSNQHSVFLSELLKDPRLRALFEFIGTPDCRIGETEKDGLVINHYVNSENSTFAQMGWHTDALRDIFYGQKIMPMLNVGIHLDNSSTDNGGLRLLPGTHNQNLYNMLFKKWYFYEKTPDKNEIGLNVDAGDLTVHDGRLWHRVALSPFVGEKSRRRVMYVPIITGKYQPKSSESKPLFYQRFIANYK